MKSRFPASILAAAAVMAATGLWLQVAAADDAPAAVAPAADKTPGVPPRDPRLPSPVPISWELNLKHGPLERLIVTVDGKDQTYWYMRYTVTNNSGRDVLFTPDFEIVAETGTVVKAVKNAPSVVYEKIKTLYNNKLMLSPLNIDGKLLQGEDNAKDSVVIFPPLDSEARNFQLFMTGLSGETSEVISPVKKTQVILQKALQLDYNIPGQAIGIDPIVKLTGTKWVMK